MTGGPRWPGRTIFRLRGLDIDRSRNSVNSRRRTRTLAKNKGLLLVIFADAADQAKKSMSLRADVDSFSGSIRDVDQEFQSPRRKSVDMLREQLRGAYFPASRWPLSCDMYRAPTHAPPNHDPTNRNNK